MNQFNLFFSIFALSLGLLICFLSVASAQTSDSAIEREIKEFVQLAEARKAPGSEITEEGLVALRKEAASLLMREEVAVEATYTQIRKLLNLAGKEVSPEQRNALAESLNNRVDVSAIQPFRELKAKISLMQKTASTNNRSSKRKEQSRLVSNWVDSRETLDHLTLYQLTWCCRHLSTFNWQMRSVGVVWEGSLQAPRSGEYEFSVSPYDINYFQPSEYNRQSMKVQINGQTVVEAKLGAWKYVGNSIELAEGTQVPIRVEFEFEIAIDGTTTKGHPFQIDRSPCAMLSWEGPGIKHSVVPAGSFTQPGGSGSGLQATYRIRYRGAGKDPGKEANPKTITLKCVEPNIDHVWVDGRNFICASPEIQQRLCDEIWRRVMDPQYWADCNELALNPPEAPAGEQSIHTKERRKHQLLRETSTSAFLTSGQRAEFLTALVNYPDIIQQMSMANAYAVYTQYWFGASDEAIAFLGTWMLLHPNVDSKLSASSTEYFQRNRWRFRQITIPTVMQYPEHFQVLLEEYLEMPDGGCCLPAAYSLGYGHLVQDRMSEWIELLDAKLADESLSGDRRVNWLLARAHAEEIRHSRGTHYELGHLDIYAGMDWITEAQLTAESNESKTLADKEKISKYTATQSWDFIDGSTTSGSPEREKWAAKIAKLKKLALKKETEREKRTRELYWEELRRRESLANARGDSASAERYKNRISLADSTHDQQ